MRNKVLLRVVSFVLFVVMSVGQITFVKAAGYQHDKLRINMNKSVELPTGWIVEYYEDRDSLDGPPYAVLTYSSNPQGHYATGDFPRNNKRNEGIIKISFFDDDGILRIYYVPLSFTLPHNDLDLYDYDGENWTLIRQGIAQYNGSDSATTDIIQLDKEYLMRPFNPALEMKKTILSPNSDIIEGDTVTFELVIKNNMEYPVKLTELVDQLNNGTKMYYDGIAGHVLLPGESVMVTIIQETGAYSWPEGLTAEDIAAGSHINTATVKGTVRFAGTDRLIEASDDEEFTVSEKPRTGNIRIEKILLNSEFIDGSEQEKFTVRIGNEKFKVSAEQSIDIGTLAAGVYTISELIFKVQVARGYRLIDIKVNGELVNGSYEFMAGVDATVTVTNKIKEPTPTPTDVPDPTPTDVPDPTPTDVPDPTPTDVPDPTPTDVPEPTPTDALNPTPTDAPNPTPTDAPNPTSTDAPDPTLAARSDDPDSDDPDGNLTDNNVDMDESDETIIVEEEDIPLNAVQAADEDITVDDGTPFGKPNPKTGMVVRRMGRRAIPLMTLDAMFIAYLIMQKLRKKEGSIG